jgi:hypothetical protein
VIAGQIAAGDGEGCVQRLGEFQIVAAGRPVESDVAAVDDEIRAACVDVFADPLEIVGQAGQAAGKMAIGNLGQAKFGHATFLEPEYTFARRQNGDEFRTSPATVIIRESG